MELAENRLEKERNLRETFVRPKSPDQPLLAIRQSAEKECLEARFVLELTGVGKCKHRNRGDSYRDETRERETALISSSLFNGLKTGQKLEFIYAGGRSYGLGDFFDWKIAGYVQGSNSSRVADEALRLYEMLRLSLKAIGPKDYEFVPLSKTEDLEGIQFNRGYIWKGAIEPEPIRICAMARKAIGFAIEESDLSEGPWVTVLPSHRRRSFSNLGSTILAARECPAPVTLRLAVERITLSEAEIDTVKDTLSRLQAGKARVKIGRLGSDEGIDDMRLCRIASRSLRVWLANPAGLRTSLQFSSVQPVPYSYLYLAGEEVFAGRNITIKSLEPGVEEQSPLEEKPEADLTEVILDLSECINELSALPIVFPKAEALRESGIRGVYSALKAPECSSGGIILGISDQNRENSYVRHGSDDRSRHTYVVGSSGTGKSTLLYHMIVQDICNGEGVTLIDPHGDLYNAVLRSTPLHRREDVVLVDPCDFGHVVGINLLECTDSRFRDVEMNFAANEMVMIFDRLYDLRQTGGPIFEQYVRNAMLLVMDSLIPGGTLVDVVRIFEDDGYRRFLKEKCKNQLVRSFWEKQAEKAYGDCKLENMAPYITSKLNQFVTNAVLRPIIGASRTTVNFRDAMDSGKILLVNLSKGVLGTLDSCLLGMLIIGKLFSAALSRVTTSHDRRKRMNVYIDEFQNFTTDSVAHLISEARKFGICLTLANQNLTQLSTGTRKLSILDTVIGNVGTVLIFRTGAMDSEKLQTYTKPELTAEDLQELPDFHVAARMLSDNIPQRPFVFKTMPMPNLSGRVVDTHEIVESSRRKYGLSRDAVERAISQKMMEPIAKDTDAVYADEEPSDK